uniref:sensor histidine kinase n=1 Tax=Wolbachia endosymbiont of Pentidionis agamae TaxID=3110435 RepID=UPI002FD4D35F
NNTILFSNVKTQVLDSEQLLTNKEIDKLLDNKTMSYMIKDCLVSLFSIFNQDDNNPLFFLKIIHSNNSSTMIMCRIFFLFIQILLIVVILVIYYLNRANNHALSVQHKTNLELQQAKEVLEKSNADKLEFLANVTHELRTPLNAIIGFTELIKGKISDSTDHFQSQEYIDDIHNAGMHLLSLINDILDFSKAESNNLTVERIRFNLSKIIDSSINMLLPRFKDAEIKFEKYIPDKQILIIADPKRMKQIMINLLSNAIKFTPKKGCIKMKVEESIEENLLIIELNDNGIGIMQQDIYKVMSVFGQVKSAYRNEGTGLGLPLSKKLVELMGGSFQIKSEPKFGTTVTLKFPYEEQAGESLVSF